jgi:hypothetical protein
MATRLVETFDGDLAAARRAFPEPGSPVAAALDDLRARRLEAIQAEVALSHPSFRLETIADDHGALRLAMPADPGERRTLLAALQREFGDRWAETLGLRPDETRAAGSALRASHEPHRGAPADGHPR